MNTWHNIQLVFMEFRDTLRISRRYEGDVWRMNLFEFFFEQIVRTIDGWSSNEYD